MPRRFTGYVHGEHALEQIHLSLVQTLKVSDMEKWASRFVETNGFDALPRLGLGLESGLGTRPHPHPHPHPSPSPSPSPSPKPTRCPAALSTRRRGGTSATVKSPGT